MTAIELAQVSVRRHDGVVLDSLDLTVRNGEVVVIVGRARSGKSAMLDAILGPTNDAAGSIRVGDVQVSDRPREVRRQVTWIARSGVLESHLTVRQNIDLILRFSGSMPRGRADVDRALRLSDVPDRLFEARAATLMPQESLSVWFAVARLRKTPVVLLDDPTSLLSPSESSRLVVRVRELSAEGTAILLTTRDARFAEEVADTIHVLEGGHLSVGRPARLPGADGANFVSEIFARSL